MRSIFSASCSTCGSWTELEHALGILVVRTPHADEGPDPLHVFTGGARIDKLRDPGQVQRPELIEEYHVLNAQCPFARQSSWGVHLWADRTGGAGGTME